MTRYVRYLDAQARPRWGLASDNRTARPLPAAPSGPGFRLPDAGAAGQPEPITRLLPPVPVFPPPNVFGIGLNYRQHAAETGAAEPDHPLVFIKASTAVIGPGDAILLPPSAPNEVDFEAELAVVIGRTARRVPESAVNDYILGYTCANDVSARDCQKRLDGQWARAKSFDTFCPLGPCLVSPHEFDAANADIICVRNGQTMQSGNTADMIFSAAKLVSYLSDQFTLLPGTVICTGTPPGVGMARKPPVFLRAGDEVEVRIAGIGSLVNPVLAEG